MKGDKVSINLRLPEELHADLKALAAREDRSLSNFIVYQLRQVVEEAGISAATYRAGMLTHRIARDLFEDAVMTVGYGVQRGEPWYTPLGRRDSASIGDDAHLWDGATLKERADLVLDALLNSQDIMPGTLCEILGVRQGSMFLTGAGKLWDELQEEKKGAGA